VPSNVLRKLDRLHQFQAFASRRNTHDFFPASPGVICPIRLIVAETGGEFKRAFEVRASRSESPQQLTL
jgi:hypothetical protein